MDMSDQVTEYLKMQGRKGGKKTLKIHGKKHYSEAGTKGAISRWKLYDKTDIKP